MNRFRWLSVAILALALVAGGGFLVQRETTDALRSELALLRDEQRELARVREENERLKAAQVPVAELERLRADRAALVRLRTEMDASIARAEQLARKLASTEAEKAPAETASEPAALTLVFDVDANGELALDGNRIDLEMLKQRFAGLARRERVALNARMPATATRIDSANFKRNLDAITTLVKQHGLSFSFKMITPQAESR